MAIQNINEKQLRERLKAGLRDGSITRDQAAKAVLEFQKAKTPEGGLIDAVWEPVKTIAGSTIGQVASGYAGLFKLATGQGIEEAAETIEDIQSDVGELVQPETKTGMSSLQTVSDLVEAGVDMARVPISGLAGITELLAGQGLEQAAKTIESVNKRGVGQTAGDRAFETTGSPLFATVVSMTPELIGAAIPVATKIKKASKFNREMAAKIKNNQSNPALGNALSDVGNKLVDGEIDADFLKLFDDLSSQAPPKVHDRLIGVADDINAGVDPKLISRQLDDIAKDISQPIGDHSLAKFIERGTQGIKADKLATETIKQGFDEAVIATVKASSPVDRKQMLKMINVLERGKVDALFATKNRPGAVAGDNLLKRIKFIKSVNQKSGQELGRIAKGLKGEQVDFAPAVDAFLTRLDDIGIRLDGNLKPIFDRSDIEGAAGAESIITKIVGRMAKGGTPDAHDLHRMKKFIDEQITYGKITEGLSGKAEGVIRKLRTDIDDTLDARFPEYDKANKTYSETVRALDSFQDVAGRKMDLFDEGADEAIGTLLRRMMGNASSRINLTNAVDRLEDVARKYGAEFEDNISAQVLFADELDSVFGSVARTGHTASVARGVKEGIEAATGQKTGIGILAETAGKLADKARGVTDENAIKAIRTLLERN